MTPETYSVQVTRSFEKELLKLVGRHREVKDHYNTVIDVLKKDPFNHSRTYPIAKLEGIPAGEGQYRIRYEHFRFRYDIVGTTVYLKACSLRSEATYRR